MTPEQILELEAANNVVKAAVAAALEAHDREFEAIMAVDEAAAKVAGLLDSQLTQADRDAATVAFFGSIPAAIAVGDSSEPAVSENPPEPDASTESPSIEDIAASLNQS